MTKKTGLINLHRQKKAEIDRAKPLAEAQTGAASTCKEGLQDHEADILKAINTYMAKENIVAFLIPLGDLWVAVGSKAEIRSVVNE